MNDVTFVEAARGLATRMITEGGDDGSGRLRFGFRLVTGRPPGDSESAILQDALRGHIATYQADKKAALELLKVGESEPPPNMNSSELAAYTALANTLLNLHEAITRP